MNKKMFLVAGMLSVMATAQNYSGRVGINTDKPQTTLDVNGAPDDVTKLDGLQAPRINGNQLLAKTYGSNQTGAIVYVTSVSDKTSFQTENVKSIGYYYFDGSQWQMFRPNDWGITGNSNIDSNINFLGTTNDADLVFKRNNVESGYISKRLEGNTAFGFKSGNRLGLPTSGLLGDGNAAYGSHSLEKLTTGSNNTAVGSYALFSNSTSTGNTAVGSSVMLDFKNGNYNTVVGYTASIASGDSNAIFGHYAGNGAGGNRNTMIGSSAGFGVSGTGDNNIFIGFASGLPRINENGNVATYTSDDYYNRINIGNTIFGKNITSYNNNYNNPYTYGFVGIGILNPTEKLDVRGNIKLGNASINGNASEGSVCPRTGVIAYNIDGSGGFFGCVGAPNGSGVWKKLNN